MTDSLDQWRIIWDTEAAKDLQKLSKSMAERIYRKVSEHLVQAPMRLGKPLRGPLKGYYRYRVGDYRIIYEIREQEITLVMIRVGHRREVYAH